MQHEERKTPLQLHQRSHTTEILYPESSLYFYPNVSTNSRIGHFNWSDHTIPFHIHFSHTFSDSSTLSSYLVEGRYVESPPPLEYLSSSNDQYISSSTDLADNGSTKNEEENSVLPHTDLSTDLPVIEEEAELEYWKSVDILFLENQVNIVKNTILSLEQQSQSYEDSQQCILQASNSIRELRHQISLAMDSDPSAIRISHLANDINHLEHTLDRIGLLSQSKLLVDKSGSFSHPSSIYLSPRDHSDLSSPSSPAINSGDVQSDIVNEESLFSLE